MCERMFSDAELAPLPELLEQRISPIRRNEMQSLLGRIHFRLFNLVCTTLQPEAPFHSLDAFFREREETPLHLKELFAGLNDWYARNPGKPDAVEAITV